jgi:5-formaminoimidazole-4-carboxamide-1-beta-D-ribofuranosyl 5'-monophosphate synthetase
MEFKCQVDELRKELASSQSAFDTHMDALSKSEKEKENQLNSSTSFPEIIVVQRLSTPEEFKRAEEFLDLIRHEKSQKVLSSSALVITPKQYTTYIDICNDWCLTIFGFKAVITRGSSCETKKESACVLS